MKGSGDVFDDVRRVQCIILRWTFDSDLKLIGRRSRLMETVVMGDRSWYPYARFGGFVMLNVLLAGAIYGLFRKAGIIGPKDQLMEAELG